MNWISIVEAIPIIAIVFTYLYALVSFTSQQRTVGELRVAFLQKKVDEARESIVTHEVRSKETGQ